MASVTIEEARAFMRAVPVVDAHCDTLLKVGAPAVRAIPGSWPVAMTGAARAQAPRPGSAAASPPPSGSDIPRRLGERLADTHVDLPRLAEAGVSGQFFACYVEPQYVTYRALERAVELIETFYAEAAANTDKFVPATGPAAIRGAHRQGKVAGVLAVEGGEALQGNLAVLGTLHRLGVRALTLTWNFRNALADGVAEDRTGGGLTRFGVEVVKEMARLGMLIDVSHLSEAGFWQVLEEASGPVVATHSNARAVCDHPRNLTDAQLKALADKGGVIGLNAAPAFVRKGAGNPGPDGRVVEATLDGVLDHADHILELIGPAHLGLGLDFDGIASTPTGLEEVSRLPYLTRRLLERGCPAAAVRAILGENWLRVMEEVGMA